MIALRYEEYRESVDIDFLVSSREGYRELRADQYGIRTTLEVEGEPVKFKIVLEGRIVFEQPGRTDAVAGVATLSVTYLAASKLLANSDRWADDSVFSRDVIDLTMMDAPPAMLLQRLRVLGRRLDSATG